MTADLDLRGLRDDLDQLLRACLSAGAAASAVVASHDRYAVDNADRVEFAGLHAVTQTDAAVRAGLAAAEELLGCLTGIDIFVLIEFCRVFCCAVAHYESDFLLHAARILSQKGSEFCCYGRSADRTLGAGSFSAALCHGVCIVITSCVSAAAAVSSGELCAQVEEKLVFLNREHFGRIAEHDGSEETDDDNECYRYYYTHPLSPFL